MNLTNKIKAWWKKYEEMVRTGIFGSAMAGLVVMLIYVIPRIPDNNGPGVCNFYMSQEVVDDRMVFTDEMYAVKDGFIVSRGGSAYRVKEWKELSPEAKSYINARKDVRLSKGENIVTLTEKNWKAYLMFPRNINIY